MVPCSRCGAMIDRTQPHVSYNMSDGEFTTDADGNECMMIHEGTCLAVLCNGCEAAEVSEESRLVPETADAVGRDLGC